MRKMFLLVMGLACACAPSQGLAQVSKMERPSAITGIGTSNLQTGTSGLQNSGNSIKQLDQRNLQTGTKPGALDAAKTSPQNSGNTDKLKNADQRNLQSRTKDPQDSLVGDVAGVLMGYQKLSGREARQDRKTGVVNVQQPGQGVQASGPITSSQRRCVTCTK